MLIGILITTDAASCLSQLGMNVLYVCTTTRKTLAAADRDSLKLGTYCTATKTYRKQLELTHECVQYANKLSSIKLTCAFTHLQFANTHQTYVSVIARNTLRRLSLRRFTRKVLRSRSCEPVQLTAFASESR